MKRLLQKNQTKGFLMMEVLIAIAAFAVVAVSLISLLNQVVDLSIQSRDVSSVQRIVHSELFGKMTMPNLREGEEVRQIEEREMTLKTVVTPLELETQEGELISNLFEIKVTAIWEQDGEEQELEASSWRNLRMYQR